MNNESFVPLQELMIPFNGDLIQVVIVETTRGQHQISVPVKPLCEHLKITWSSQLQRVKRDPILAGAMHTVRLINQEAIQRYNLTCLPLDFLSPWLFGVNISRINPSYQQKVRTYQQTLPETIQRFINTHSRPAQESTVLSPVSHDTSITTEENAPLTEIIPIRSDLVQVTDDPLQERMIEMLSNLPEPTVINSLTSTNSQIDWSLREASFAREEQWKNTAETKVFMASTKLQVYLGTPTSPLDIDQAQAKIRELGGSTILTARVAMGLWNLRRHDANVSINGSAAIRLDEILAWRGFKKHQRIAYSGGNKQRTDGYRNEHKQQIIKDLDVLARMCVRGQCIVTVKGRRKTIMVDGAYLRYSIVSTANIKKEQHVLGFFVSPGDWIAAYQAHDNVFLTEIDRRIFELNPQNEQHELRIALYLVEIWRRQAKPKQHDLVQSMEALLSGSMIPIDFNSIARFANRIEQALKTLWQRGILGKSPQCLTPVDRQKPHWSKAWLASQWSISPPHVYTDQVESRQREELAEYGTNFSKEEK